MKVQTEPLVWESALQAMAADAADGFDTSVDNRCKRAARFSTELTGDQLQFWRHYLPMRRKFRDKADAKGVSLKARQVVARVTPLGCFDSIEWWRSLGGSRDAILVGVINDPTNGRRYFPLAWWAPEQLLPFSGIWEGFHARLVQWYITAALITWLPTVLLTYHLYTSWFTTPPIWPLLLCVLIMMAVVAAGWYVAFMRRTAYLDQVVPAFSRSLSEARGRPLLGTVSPPLRTTGYGS